VSVVGGLAVGAALSFPSPHLDGLRRARSARLFAWRCGSGL